MYLVLTAAVLALVPGTATATGNIGCLFSNTLCENEWCFDDYAFGRCFPVDGDIKEKDLVRYHLTEADLHAIEAEMQRLYHLGYRWSHTYTQCVLQDLLSAMQEGNDFDVSKCNDQLDQDLEGALRAIEGEEEEAVDPRDLAIVRFTPSANNPHSAFADEFYFPAIQGGKILPAPFRVSSNKTTGSDLPDTHSKDQKEDSKSSFETGKVSLNPVKTQLGNPSEDTNRKHSKVDKLSPPSTSSSSSSSSENDVIHENSINSQGYKSNDGGNYKVPYAPYELDYDLFPVSEKAQVFYDYPRDVYDSNKHNYGFDSAYPKNSDPSSYGSEGYLSDEGYKVYSNDQGGYLGPQTYAVPYDNQGYMSDQGYMNDGKNDESNDILYNDRKSEERVPTIQPMSNKEYMRKLGFHVPDFNEEKVRPSFPSDNSNYGNNGMRNANKFYRKRTNSTGGPFNIKHFMSNFNSYLKEKNRNQDVTSNQEKREGSDRVGDVKPIQGVTSSKMRALQEKLDPQMKEDFMNVAIDVMRRNRDKPQYNTAELKKIAAFLDNLRKLQQGPMSPLPVRYIERKETEPLYGKEIMPPMKLGNPEEPMDPSGSFQGMPGAYQRVDKAVPYGAYGHQYPHLSSGLHERYAYGTPDMSYYGGEREYYATEGGHQDDGRVDGVLGVGEVNVGGVEGEKRKNDEKSPPMYYHRQPYGPVYPSPNRLIGDQPAYDRNSISSIVSDDNSSPIQEQDFTYDNHENGFGSQINFPHFYKSAQYDPYIDYNEELPLLPEANADPSAYVKKDEENEDADYGTVLGPNLKTLPNNFDRSERHDTKKPGPDFNTNNFGFYDYEYYGNPSYHPLPQDHTKYPQYFPNFAYYPNDPYDTYYDQRNYVDEDVDTVGGEGNEHGSRGSYHTGVDGKDGRYFDDNGKEIDIGLSTGNGGMFPLATPDFEQGHFNEFLRKEGMEGNSLYPGPHHQMLKQFNGRRLPDLLLTEEMVVDNVSRGLHDQHRGQMSHPLMEGMMPHGVSYIKSMHGAKGNHTGTGTGDHMSPPVPTYIYIDVNMSFSTEGEALDLASWILHSAGLSRSDIKDLRVEDNRMLFTLRDNLKGVSEQDVAKKAEDLADSIYKTWNVQILRAGVASSQGGSWSMVEGGGSDGGLMVGAAVVSGVMAALVVAASVVLVLRRHAAHRSKFAGLTNRDTEASKDYQDLCRARMAAKNKSTHSTSSEKDSNLPGTHGATGQRITSLSKDGENGGNSPGSRSSTSSWSEEPVAPNMDISTGHMVLSYMEDHLKNKSRLDQEWVGLCAYEAEPSATMVAKKPTNQKKNRYPGVLPYDHNRVHLNQQANISGSDYVNASSITDHDPRNPAYIATQGPLATTTADFWQLVWEQGSVVIVMLSKLNENGHTLCHHYWPQEGSQLYHIYEVHLVSEHIWCDDYLVRSFYLKNTRTGETRTVTQFHFLSWPDTAIPASTKALLEFRRKVNKSYRGRSCPIIVHCSDGIGRAGTYILIDMVLNRMAKGAKEIDIAATLEHIRDQRGNMVTTKLQFEFVLMAVAEEVHAILKALPQ